MGGITEVLVDYLYELNERHPFCRVSEDGMITTHRNSSCDGADLSRGKISEGYQEAVEELVAAGFVRFEISPVSEGWTTVGAFGFVVEQVRPASEGWTLPEFLPVSGVCSYCGAPLVQDITGKWVCVMCG